eukprot:COSAG04_NODE_15660_length_524_cov_1.534118_1_plen_53_part_10
MRVADDAGSEPGVGRNARDGVALLVFGAADTVDAVHPRKPVVAIAFHESAEVE